MARPLALISTTTIRIGKRHAIAQDEERADRDGECTGDVRDGHERAAFETVGEGTRRQRKKEPGQAVGCDDARNGQWVRIDHDGHQGYRPQHQPIAPAGEGEPSPQPEEGAAEGLPPDAVSCPASGAHRWRRRLRSHKLSGPRMDAGLVPSGFWRDNGGCRLSVNQIR